MTIVVDNIIVFPYFLCQTGFTISVDAMTDDGSFEFGGHEYGPSNTIVDPSTQILHRVRRPSSHHHKVSAFQFPFASMSEGTVPATSLPNPKSNPSSRYGSRRSSLANLVGETLQKDNPYAASEMGASRASSEDPFRSMTASVCSEFGYIRDHMSARPIPHPKRSRFSRYYSQRRRQTIPEGDTSFNALPILLEGLPVRSPGSIRFGNFRLSVDFKYLEWERTLTETGHTGSNLRRPLSHFRGMSYDTHTHTHKATYADPYIIIKVRGVV